MPTDEKSEEHGGPRKSHYVPVAILPLYSFARVTMANICMPLPFSNHCRLNPCTRDITAQSQDHARPLSLPQLYSCMGMPPYPWVCDQMIINLKIPLFPKEAEGPSPSPLHHPSQILPRATWSRDQEESIQMYLQSFGGFAIALLYLFCNLDNDAGGSEHVWEAEVFQREPRRGHRELSRICWSTERGEGDSAGMRVCKPLPCTNESNWQGYGKMEVNCNSEPPSC